MRQELYLVKYFPSLYFLMSSRNSLWGSKKKSRSDHPVLSSERVKLKARSFCGFITSEREWGLICSEGRKKLFRCCKHLPTCIIFTY